MKRNFTHENFEDFLRSSADGLRMRPSEDVWKGISGRLKKQRRTGGIFQASFFLLLSLFSYLVVSNTSQLLSSPSTASTQKVDDGSGKEGSTTSSSSRRTREEGSSVTSSPSLSQFQQQGEEERLASEFGIENVPPFTPIMGGLSFEPVPVDSYDETPVAEEASSKEINEEKKGLYPYTIESVVNSFKKGPKSRWGFQFFFTPTMSYRKLSENRSFLRTDNGASFSPAATQNVNNAVTHKPDLGLEVGVTSKYALTKNLKIRAGLQINMNRYDIKAYEASSEVGTIVFNGNNNRDSINLVTGYSNRAGYDQEWITNTYLQISAPIGVEVKIAGNENVQFGVATTIQPTYVLGDRAYLITTDYKNYAELPHLTRRFNVNTSIETFVGYSTGRLAWQVGPQVRYQLLSSFISKYPVKENLFDFGLRIGVSLNK